MIKHLFAAALAMTIAATSVASHAPRSGHAAHPGHAPLIVAHRGASFDAPENTLAAFKLGWEQGADAIEGDFWLTADNQIACTHDESFKRISGVDRKVMEMTLAEVDGMDVGSWKSAKYAGERPPHLKEILAIVPQGKIFLLEIKDGVRLVSQLAQELKAHNFPPERLRIISFKAEVIRACKEAMPEVKAYWLTDFKPEKGSPAGATSRPTLPEVLATLKETKADGLDCRGNLEVVTESFVKALRDNAYELHAWTIDDPKVARRLVALGFDSITTNKPAEIRAAISR
jgi:glycerophosphoryl diester phosphodiesterase